jgi:phosphoribosylamine--glycine ligase
MKILVVGGGGREHALVWKLKQSPRVDQIYCAPGNGGIAQLCPCEDIDSADIRGLVRFAERKKIDLTVVGPEGPLTLGIVDRFEEKGLAIFGPSREAARIEGSKVFAKDLMVRAGIPTAEHRTFSGIEETLDYLRTAPFPVVLKADGLAAGKGVMVCNNRNEAYDAVDQIMRKRVFGDAGNRIVVEEFLRGEEVSMIALTDGKSVVLLPTAQDHKAVFEGDRGPNTGGMGAYAPAPIASSKLLERVAQKIMLPVIRTMESEGCPFRGALYAGLMITTEGPKVLEFNCRFGDPETQVILPLLETDLVEAMMAVCEGRLDRLSLLIRDQAAVCVVMAASGYPGPYEKGKPIRGLDCVPPEILVFHAGSKRKGKEIVTSGGRVLGVTALGDTIRAAVESAYRAVGHITFDGAYYRKDIAHRAML